MWIVLILLFLASIVFGALTTLPLALMALLCLTVIFKRPWIFVLAFFTGLFFDLSQVRILGQTSTFLLIFIFLLFLYERKFEIQSAPFVFFAGFLGSLGYLVVFGYNYVFWQALASALIAILIFKVLMVLEEMKLVNGK